MLTLEQRVYLIKCYGIGDVSYSYAISVFNDKFPDVHPSKTAVKKLVRKFTETGSVLNKMKKKRTRDEDDAATILVLNSVDENPKASVRDRADEISVSKSEVHRILRCNKLKPYKPKFRHTLENGDDARRLEFCLWAGAKIMENPFFHHDILFSDECTFSTNGVVSSQNSRWWAVENPDYKISCKSQRYKKVNVWCGVLCDKIIGPYFLEENLNQHHWQ